MLERGGTTTQSGILYQNTLAALFLGRLCDARARPESDRIVKVRVEAPGAVDDVVVSYADGHGDWCQAKENVAKGDKAWRKMWKDFEKRFHSKEFRTGSTNNRLFLQVGEARTEHTLLRGLCLRASGSETYEEWWSGLNEDQKSLIEDIRDLLDPEHAGDEAVWLLMSHLHVDRAHLELLEDRAPDWMPAADKPAHTLLALLRDRIGGHARVRKVFLAHELRATLQSDHQVGFETPADIEELRSRIQTVGAPLREYENRIEGIHIERPETAAMASWARGAEGEDRLAFLLDRAGSGKTVVMHDAMEELERDGVLVLAMRADRQLTGVETDEVLQERLDLPERLESAIGRLAELERVVVLVDQVDALSLTLSGARRTLDYMLGVIARLRSIPNVRIVVSCRSFDYSTDPRLRQIQTDRKWPLEDFRDEDAAAACGGH